jgi:mannose/cellobiose epimerase-like protein (N-acyl-D-glucosamine 2-epimerase family)
MVHCFAIGHLLGLPGADKFVDHGMDFLWNRHRDMEHGGYFWGVEDTGAPDSTKQAYGHAFVLLAVASAKVVGHPYADWLLADVTDVLHRRFWDSDVGATTEEYAADWQPLSAYRGQNSNMHLTEALMAAFEVTNDQVYLDMADSIAHLIIDQHARAELWRVPEHFDILWNVDHGYRGDPMFRPQGTTPGHALEWSRLLVQLWELGGHKHAWMLPAAKSLFKNACALAWDQQLGGFYYTLDWDNKPDQTDRYWWPCAEGIAAASALRKVSSDPQFELWYRRIWGFVDAHFIDRRSGGWFAELDASLIPVERVFEGKQDLYHALQACLIPLLPANGSVTRHLSGPKPFDLLNGGTKRK